MNWRGIGEGDKATVIAHPVAPGYLVLVSDSVGDQYMGAIRAADGYETGQFGVTVIDEVREAWDSLDGSVRQMLDYTRQTRKITAIKALRALTGLGLTEAKRAIETFNV